MIPYEEERQKRIADNNKKIKALNLQNLAQSLVESSSATKKPSSGDFKKRKAELLEISMSQNQEEEGLSSETQHNMPDDLTIWKEVAPKGKKGKLYGLGSIGTNASKYIIGSCSNAFKEKNIEQELLKWKEKANEQERINQEQKQKLEQQQKRIESNESMLAVLFEKLNMPLPPNFACATPMQDEPNDVGETSNGNNADNFGFD